MKLPQDCSVKLTPVHHSALLSPRVFFAITVESQELGISVTRYVRARRLFLRLRLWLALRETLVMVRKLKKFKANHA